MPLLFLISWLFIALALCRYFASGKPFLTRIAYFGVLAYLALLVSAFPFAAFNRWSFSAHVALFAFAALFAGIALWKNRPVLVLPEFHKGKTALFLTGLVLGVGLQWNGIYHVYATHDPSAYLNGALHLQRTGTFLHVNEVARLASAPGNEVLKSVLSETKTLEPWQLTRNYGIVPLDIRNGVSSYHGFFAAPFFLTIGAELWGPERALRIHWLHFLLIAVLGIAILQHWLGTRSLWPWTFPLLFAVSPLVSPLFREPLSEPLACVLFLGALLGLLHWKRRGNPADLYLFVLCLALALSVRISSILYIPFVLAALYFSNEKRAALAYCLVSAITLAVTFKLSPAYASEILSFYSQIISRKIPAGVFLLLGLAAVVAIAGLAVRSSCVSFLRNTRIWRALFLLYGVGLFGALLFRYGKLVTRLDYYIGGYPFVLYNLDSLLFYASPSIALVGLIFWFRRSARRAHRRLFFLQTFFPFAAFFYFAFRFLPLNLQPNFQRYLIIELLPLCLIGFVLVVSRLRLRSQVFALSFTALWCGYLTVSLHHPEMEKGSLQAYRDLEQKIQRGGTAKLVAVGLETDWQETAFLMPLTTGAANFPLITVPSGFEARASQALRRLEELGYQPILLVPEETSPFLRENATAGWDRFESWQHCYDYPKFDLAAPPLELSRRCANFSLYRRAPWSQVTVQEGILPAWHFRNQKLPLKTTHWYGFEVDGRKVCGGRFDQEVVAELDFFPDRAFVPPTLRVNGLDRSKGICLREIAGSRSAKSYRARIAIPASNLQCNRWNSVDILFPPVPPAMTPRKAIVLSTKIVPASSRPTILSRLIFEPDLSDKQ